MLKLKIIVGFNRDELSKVFSSYKKFGYKQKSILEYKIIKKSIFY